MVQRFPATQVFPQQGWPGSPHGVHIPGTPAARPVQSRPAVQLPPLLPPVPQQIWAIPPQAAHLFPVIEMEQPSPTWQAVVAAPTPAVGQHG
jgi:hypothetical protein